MPQTPALATHAQRGKSWMLPEAKSEDLLYVGEASYPSYGVFVYKYKTEELLGNLGLHVYWSTRLWKNA